MMLSNHATQRNRDEAHKLGAEFFFDKPDEIIELVKAITTMASNVQGRRGLGAPDVAGGH